MYVQDDAGLGGVFGFIGKAVSKVVSVVGGVVGGISKGGTVQVAPPQIIVQSPPPQVAFPTGGMPGWVLPAAVAGGALLLVMTMRRR